MIFRGTNTSIQFYKLTQCLGVTKPKEIFFCSVYSLFKINFALTMKPVEYQLFHPSTNLTEKKMATRTLEAF